MARIPREEHAKIRARVELEKEKVAAVAASYDCTPANIYAILAKLRRNDVSAGSRSDSAPLLAEPDEPTPAEPAVAVEAAPPSVHTSEAELPLFGTLPLLEPLAPEPEPIETSLGVITPTFPEEVPALTASPTSLQPPPDAPSTKLISTAQPPVGPTSSDLQAPAARPAVKPVRPSAPPAHRPSISGPEAKPATSRSKGGKIGIALMMRTSDGEEAVHPFRSIEELLPAAKPILRTAAKSPEPIWFSIQTVDLDALEETF